jgi:hypothetical protein
LSHTEAAMNHYVSNFGNGQILHVNRANGQVLSAVFTAA